jgi:hypothetical protein
MNEWTYEFLKTVKLVSTLVCRNSHRLFESLYQLKVKTSQMKEGIDIFQIREIVSWKSTRRA